MEALVEECKMGFARKLASPSLKTREKAISLLVAWLTSKKHIEDEELKKIWKGLFYCVWHSDKVPVQTDLIERLTSIPEKLDGALSLQFFKVFLVTMRREWAGIDRLRLDKFYLLLRRYLVHMLMVLERSGWDASLTKEFMDALLEWTFLAKDHHAALGINLHYADIFLNELEKFLPLRDDTFKILIEPFIQVIAHASDKSLLQRIRENIFGCLLEHGHAYIRAKQNETLCKSDAELLGFLALSSPLTFEAFKLASMPSVSQANRKLLYELHREYETLEKLFNASGIVLPISGKIKKRKKITGQTDPKVKQKKKKNKHATKSIDVLALGTSEMVEGEGPGQKSELTSFTADKNGTNEELKLGEANVPECQIDTVSNNGTLSNEKKASKQKIKLSKRKVSEAMTDPSKSSRPALSGIKKSNKKSKKEVSEIPLDIVDVAEKHANDVKENSDFTAENDARVLTMDDSVISNLKRQFDLLAEEISESDTCLSPVAMITAVSPRNTGSKKKKLVDVCENKGAKSPKKVDGESIMDTFERTTSSSTKVKKVRFALKKNLVWRPTSPLPPESVRVPPSATPRGSALKKGVPPGPIISETKSMAIKQRKGTPRRPQNNARSITKKPKTLSNRRNSL